MFESMKWKFRKSDVTVFILLSLVLFLGLELGLRELMPQLDLNALTGRTMSQGPIDRWADEDAFCAYQPKPRIEAVGKTVNLHGHMSTPAIDFIKPDSTTRILFLGGSSTAGTGFNIDDVHTWPWHTIERLRALGHRVDFINGAAGGYTTFESYGRLWSRLRFFKPDIVVVMHGWNDSYYVNRLEEWPTLWRSNKNGGTGFHYKEYMEDFAPLGIDRIISWSQLLTRLRLAVYEKPGRGVVLSEEELHQPIETTYDPEVLNLYADNMRLIKDFCQSNSMELFLIKQPTMLTRSDIDSSEFHWSGHSLSAGSLMDVLDHFYATIDTTVAPSYIIDLRYLSGNTEFLADQVHPSLKGCDTIANVVSAHLHDYLSAHVTH